jgi:hypothetical protein
MSNNCPACACPVCKHKEGRKLSPLVELGSSGGLERFCCLDCGLHFGFPDMGSDAFWDKARIFADTGLDPHFNDLYLAMMRDVEPSDDVFDSFLRLAELRLFGTTGGLEPTHWGALNG